MTDFFRPNLMNVQGLLFAGMELLSPSHHLKRAGVPVVCDRLDVRNYRSSCYHSELKPGPVLAARFRVYLQGPHVPVAMISRCNLFRWRIRSDVCCLPRELHLELGTTGLEITLVFRIRPLATCLQIVSQISFQKDQVCRDSLRHSLPMRVFDHLRI